MISELFFYGKLKDVKNMLIYEDDFVLFYLNMQLKDSEEFNKEKVEKLLEKFYGKENIKNNGILKFCDQHFKSKEKNYILNISEEELKNYEITKEFEKDIDELISLDQNSLYEVLEKEITSKEISFTEKLKKCIIYYYGDSKLTLEKRTELLYKYFYNIKNYYKIYRIIDSKLENIPELFNSIEITELDFSEQHQSFLIFNNVFTIKNLKYITIDTLISIFCNDIQHFIDEIGKYAINKEKIISNLSEIFKSLIKPEWDVVLQKRYDINTNQKRTLADIGKELNLSRERVRQIERKAIQKLLYNKEEINRLIYCFYKDINKENKEFITIEEFYKYINNESLTKYLIILLCSEELEMRINEDTGIIYNSEEITFEEIIKEAEEQLENIIIKTDIEEYDVIQNNIIKNNYRLYQDKVLVKKELNISYIYLNEIRENYIDGYDIGSEDDYNRLIGIIKEKYGDIEVSSMHSIQAMIDRNDFIQIDRGRYKAREYAAILPEKLVDEIINFIIKNQPVIAYSLIFERFKKQLEKLDINNRFYLKGCIDEKLPEEFNTSRDFINTDSDGNYTTYDVMREIFKSFDGSFTIEDVKDKMPGLKGYNYENYARLEEENGLIQIGTKSYIYIEKLGITEQTKQELKEYIDGLFIKLDSNILTSKKIYASLNIMNKNLFNKLNITARFGDFELFSIIQHLYKNEYFYSRPIISKEEEFTTTSYMLIKEYAKRLNIFSYSDIKKYIYKMNLGGLSSYLNFMDDLSDEYIQVNKDSMIRKDELSLTNEQLQKIDNFMELLLKNKEIKTDDFDGYFMLPRLTRGWNKYLLVGIIKTYFREKYDIQSTSNFYDKTDFIIRRIN
ncbi:MAG: hypothetical protein IJ223_03535 [Clostridia bacterium]|nr:hypothetical protein [Clostridia bacterium]